MTRPTTPGVEPKEYSVLQIMKSGEFIHEISGKIANVLDYNDNGQPAKGISLLIDTDKYLRIDRLIDTNQDNFDKYKVGKDIKVHAYPTVINRSGIPSAIFYIVDADHKFTDEPHLAQIKDWKNRGFVVGKELTIPVSFRPFFGKNRNGMEYTAV